MHTISYRQIFCGRKAFFIELNFNVDYQAGGTLLFELSTMKGLKYILYNDLQ